MTMKLFLQDYYGLVKHITITPCPDSDLYVDLSHGVNTFNLNFVDFTLANLSSYNKKAG